MINDQSKAFAFEMQIEGMFFRNESIPNKTEEFTSSSKSASRSTITISTPTTHTHTRCEYYYSINKK